MAMQNDQNECPLCASVDDLCPLCHGKYLTDEELDTQMRFESLMKSFLSMHELLDQIWHSNLTKKQQQHILSNFGY